MRKLGPDATTRRQTDAAAFDGHAWPRLNDGEIHVWKTCLDECAHAQDSALLSPDETDRAARCRFERNRTRFITGRAVLRRILGSYLAREPAGLVFIQGDHGKPRLEPKDTETALYFNVTHADSIALYAVTRSGAVGIDVERVREIPEWAAIADGFFNPDERAFLHQQPTDLRGLAFLKAWTRREAFLKATGEGLTGKHAGRTSAREAKFSVESFTPVPGYLASIASEIIEPRVIIMTWRESVGLPPGNVGTQSLLS